LTKDEWNALRAAGVAQSRGEALPPALQSVVAAAAAKQSKGADGAAALVPSEPATPVISEELRQRLLATGMSAEQVERVLQAALQRKAEAGSSDQGGDAGMSLKRMLDLLFYGGLLTALFYALYRDYGCVRPLGGSAGPHRRLARLAPVLSPVHTLTAAPHFAPQVERVQ
jgi:hypothetical protein